jgi:competence protein ComEC
LAIAALAIGGSVAGVLSDVSDVLFLAAGIAGGAAAALELPRQPRAGCICAAIFCAAAWNGAAARDAMLSSPLQTWYRSIAAAGRLSEVVFVRGSLAADAAETERGIRLLVDVDAVRPVGEPWRPMTGRIQMHFSGTDAAERARTRTWIAGRTVVAPALLREPQAFRNPGGAGEKWLQLHRTADLVGTVKSSALVTVGASGWWNDLAAAVRSRVRAAAASVVAPRSIQAAAIMSAILIGDRAGLDDDVQRQMRAAGTYHVIAISGGNVALLTGACFVLLRHLVRSFRTVAAVTIGLVLSYSWIVGGEASVQRAAVAATVYLLISLWGWRSSALQVLVITALVLTLAQPLTAIDVGAWLSFGATCGIVVGARRFVTWAGGDHASTERQPPRPRGERAARAVWRILLGLFASTLAAELVLAPVSAAIFSRVGVLGLVLNFVAIPAMAVVQFAGLAVLAIHGWWPSGAALAGRVVALAADALIGSASAVDSAPWLVWRVPPTPVVLTIAYYAALGAACVQRGSSRARRLCVGAAALFLVLIVTAPGIESAAPSGGRLRITVLDVGQGDATLVQFPDRHSLLIDAGGGVGASGFGARVVTPALWSLGTRRLDWIAITHPDIDHIGGAIDVQRDFAPREVWESVPVPPNPELTALRRASHERSIAWRQILAGHRLEVGSVTIEALHPPAPEWERRRVRNDDSMVLRLQFGNLDLLMTGDAGAEFERRFVGERLLPLRIVKVAHHGSRSSSSPAFVRTFKPQVAVVSAGRGNLFGHPAPEVIDRFAQAGAVIFRTDLDGAIVIETDGATVDVMSMSGRRWSFASPAARPVPAQPWSPREPFGLHAPARLPLRQIVD